MREFDDHCRHMTERHLSKPVLTPASHFLASRRRMRSRRSSSNLSSQSKATSSRRALMLQTRTATVTRRLVMTTLSRRLNPQCPRRAL
eukprot:5416636-Pleurochrysis_carterae.AAC.1